MNAISAILRIICGLVLVIFSYSTHRRIGERVAAGEPVQIVGVTLGASAGQLTFAFLAIGLIGALLIALGIVTLIKKQE